MNIPPYWIVGSCEIAGMRFRLHGSSGTSMEEARSRMAEREGLLRRFHEGSGGDAADLRAQLTSIIVAEKGEEYAAEIFEPTLERLSAQSIVTRNRYGAEVLNSTELCFVDIDHVPASMWERVLAFFGRAGGSAEERLLSQLRHLHEEQPRLAMRLYRTAGGWRLMLEGDGLAPDSAPMLALFRRLHADPAYVRLCARQGCWRARLSPKPGRLAQSLPPYPRRCAADTPAEDEAEWIARYAQGCEGVAVCRLVESFGPDICHPLVPWHDARTSALRDALRLA